jgi:hypothetical protein
MFIKFLKKFMVLLLNKQKTAFRETESCLITCLKFLFNPYLFMNRCSPIFLGNTYQIHARLQIFSHPLRLMVFHRNCKPFSPPYQNAYGTHQASIHYLFRNIYFNFLIKILYF